MSGHPLAMALWAVAAAQAHSSPPEANADTIVITGERTKRKVSRKRHRARLRRDQPDIQAASADRVSDLLQLVPNVQLGGGSEGPPSAARTRLARCRRSRPFLAATGRARR